MNLWWVAIMFLPVNVFQTAVLNNIGQMARSDEMAAPIFVYKNLYNIVFWVRFEMILFPYDQNLKKKTFA